MIYFGKPASELSIPEALTLAVDERSDEQAELVRECYLSEAEPMVALNKQIAAAEAQLFLGRIMFFIGTSVIAYIYAWRKGVFRWD